MEDIKINKANQEILTSHQCNDLGYKFIACCIAVLLVYWTADALGMPRPDAWAFGVSWYLIIRG